MQELLRDKILAELAGNFDAQQLQMIDLAIGRALEGYQVTPVETLPATGDGMRAEVAEYLARKKSKGLAEGSLEQYALVLRAFALYSRKAVQEIRDLDIMGFLDGYERYRGISRHRKDNMRIILNGFFRYLSDSGRVPRNPMVTVDAIQYRKRVRKPLSDVELERVRSACRTDRERALIETFYATGCRVSELVRLNRSDIDYSERRMTVLGKGNKERVTFINAAAVVALDRYFAGRSDTNPALFVSDRAPHQRLKRNALEKIIKHIGQRAGLTRGIHPHLIRHTLATTLYSRGVRLEDIKAILGHESVSTTLIYIKQDVSVTQHAYRQAV